MLTLKEKNNEIIIKSSYSYAKRVRNIPGAHFDHESKVWKAPLNSLQYIQKNFVGEIYYQTPQWKLEGKEEPPKQDIKFFFQPVTLPTLNLVPYDYQKLGIQFCVDRIEKLGFCMVGDQVGLGKCHGKGTKVLMSDGTIKNVEDIKKGEFLMGDDGTPRKVLNTVHGQSKMYKVTLRNGDSFTCNADHILSLKMVTASCWKHYRGGDIINISVKEYLKLPDWVKIKCLKAYKNPISFPYQEVPIDPYIYGLWLGDGYKNSLSFSINDNDKEIISEIYKYAKDNDLHMRIVKERGCSAYHLSKGPQNQETYTEKEIVKESSVNGKHILDVFKYNSKEIQLEVLAGLLDTDGYIVDNCYEIVTKYEQLKEDILFLCRCVGLSVTNRIKTVNGVDYFRIFISGNTHEIPNRLKRKKSTPRKQKKNPLIYSFDIKEIDESDYYGFNIDGNHLYLLGDFTVTHNTIEATGTLKWYKQHRHINRILIICKKSIKHQWATELNRYTGWEKIYVTGETPKKRKEAYEAVKSGGILITNYHNFLNDTELIKEVNFDFCIVDEAHCIKGRSTKMNKNIGSVIKGKRTILMTGTPIMSKPDDIYGIIKMAAPGYFGTYKDFEDEYLVIEYGIYGRQIVGAKNLDKLQNKISNFLIRRTSDDVKLELPEILPPIKVIVEKDNVQKKIMGFIEAEKEALDAKKEGLDDSEESRLLIDMINEKSKMYIAASQFAADDPKLFKLGKASKIKSMLGKMVPDNYKMSNKTEATIDLVQEILASDEKVIIFCLYATSAFMLKDLIEENLGEKVVMYTGRENDEQRKESYNSFLNDVNVLIGTEACAEGLNLQVAGYLINYEQSETYAQRNQRIGRIRRIGSKYDELKVYDIITKNSFDEIRYNKLMRDKDISEALIG